MQGIAHLLSIEFMPILITILLIDIIALLLCSSEKWIRLLYPFLLVIWLLTYIYIAAIYFILIQKIELSDYTTYMLILITTLIIHDRSKTRKITETFGDIDTMVLIFLILFTTSLLMLEYFNISLHKISFGLFMLSMLLWIPPLNSEYRRHTLLKILIKKPNKIINRLHSQDREGLASHYFQDAIGKFVDGDFEAAIISLCLTLERIDKTKKLLGSIQITTSLGKLNLSTIRATLVHPKIEKIIKISHKRNAKKISYKELRDKLRNETYNIAIQIFEKIKQLLFTQNLT